MKTTHLITLLFSLSILISCHGQPGPDGQKRDAINHSDLDSIKTEKTEQVNELIKTYAAYGKFNGSILVSHEGEIIYQNGFGWANMEWDIPNRPETKHRLASITKQFTAVLIIQLVEEGKLALDVPISKYLPHYPKNQGGQITIHHLLTHSSGIPDYGSFTNYLEFERERHNPEEIIQLFAELPLEFNPGARFSYSNSGYALLGLIIEKIQGKSYAEVLQEKILNPLKMQNTGYDHQHRILKKRASGYYKSWGSYKNSAYVDMSLAYAAGALYSSIVDLYLWDQALYTEKILSKKYLNLLFQSYLPARGRHYGYGWFTDNIFKDKHDQKVKTVSHGGGIDGFRTKITRIPSTRSSIILLDNAESGSLSDITYQIACILFDLPYDLPDQSVAGSLREVINAEGIQKGVDHFQKVKLASGYYLDEQKMIVLGYDFLRSGQADHAAVVFELGIDQFPASFNVYDSYAEALMTLGRKEEAIQYYLKSIEINPGNQNGLKMLNKLGVDTEPLTHKVSPGHLKILTGEYVAENKRTSKDEAWMIEIGSGWCLNMS